MMFKELAELFKFVPASSSAADYKAAVVDDNLLGKPTLATRRLTHQRLSELYGLDPALPIFRVLRDLWAADHAGRPLLALLVALARDPLLRLTADAVLAAPLGRPVDAAMLDQALAIKLGARLNPAVRHKVARNAASSWTQSGHLAGRTNKLRTKPATSATNATMAILLGHVCGLRGLPLLSTPWVRALDIGQREVVVLAQSAHRMNLLNFRHLGDIVEIQFPSLLRPDEEACCHV